MKLMEFLTPESMTIGLKASEKWGAIEELLDIIIKTGKLAPAYRQRALDALLVRERTKSTGLERGVAIPHASLDCIDEIAGAMAVVPEGLDFDSVDKSPAQFIVLLLIPRHGFQKHISTLAGIARLMNNGTLRSSLLAATSPKEAMAVIMRVEEETTSTQV